MAVAVVFLLARKIMPALISMIVGTRIKEIFLLSSLVACLGMAYLTASLGLSLALGAFLAGMIIQNLITAIRWCLISFLSRMFLTASFCLHRHAA